MLGVAEVGMRGRDARIDADRLLDQRDRLGEAAALPPITPSRCSAPKCAGRASSTSG